MNAPMTDGSNAGERFQRALRWLITHEAVDWHDGHVYVHDGAPREAPAEVIEVLNQIDEAQEPFMRQTDDVLIERLWSLACRSEYNTRIPGHDHGHTDCWIISLAVHRLIELADSP